MTSRQLRLLVAGFLSLLVLIIVVQNTDVVTVNFLLWEFSMSRVILILLCTGAGFGVGYVVARIRGSQGGRPRAAE